MADDVNAGNGAGSPSTPDNPDAAGNTGRAVPDAGGVSPEMLGAINTAVQAALGSTRNALFAELRKGLKEVVKPAEPDGVPGKANSKHSPEEIAQALDRLQKQNSELQERARQVDERAKAASLKAAILGRVSDAKRANLLYSVLRQKAGEALSLEGDIAYLNLPEGRQELDSFVDDYLKSEDGEIFLPPRKGPGAATAGQSSGAAEASTVNEWLALDYKAIMKRAQLDPAGFIAYRRAHPDVHSKKEREFLAKGN